MEATCILGAALPPEWPQPDLLDALPLQAAASPSNERYGIWVMIERESGGVVGDIGFLGPPERGSVEIGYSVIPDRRRRGYASEAARALVDWALDQPGVEVVVASPESGNLASERTLERVGFQRASEVAWRYAGPNEDR